MIIIISSSRTKQQQKQIIITKKLEILIFGLSSLKQNKKQTTSKAFLREKYTFSTFVSFREALWDC